MSYATQDAVEQVSGLAFTEVSRPTTIDQVKGFIADIDAEVRGALIGGGYEPDTTDPDALAILRLYASRGVAAMVMEARHQTEDAALFHRRYDAWLSLVRQGKASGLARRSNAAAALPSSRYTRSPSTHPGPAFKRGEVQW